jgi:hypothetical protein
MQVGSAHITRICMTFTIMEYQALAVQNGGSARGYHELRTSWQAPANVRRTLGRAEFLYIGAGVGNSLFCRIGCVGIVGSLVR